MASTPGVAMLSFQQAFSQVDDDPEMIQAIESAISGLPNPCPMAKLQSCLESVGLNEREVMAVVNAAMHSAKQGMCDPTVIAPDVWKIVKSVRPNRRCCKLQFEQLYLNFRFPLVS